MSEVNVEQGLDLILRGVAKDVIGPQCPEVFKKENVIGGIFREVHSVIYRKLSPPIFAPALTNVLDGLQKPIVLQTLQNSLNSSLRGGEGWLREETVIDGNVIFCHRGCC